APRRAQRHDDYAPTVARGWTRSIADRGSPAAVVTASTDIFPEAVIPAAPTDVIALARSPIAARTYRIVAWPRIATGNAKTEHSANGHTGGDGAATTGSGWLTPARGNETQHQRRDGRCCNEPLQHDGNSPHPWPP